MSSNSGFVAISHLLIIQNPTIEAIYSCAQKCRQRRFFPLIPWVVEYNEEHMRALIWREPGFLAESRLRLDSSIGKSIDWHRQDRNLLQSRHLQDVLRAQTAIGARETMIRQILYFHIST